MATKAGPVTLPGRDREADMLTLADAFFDNLRRDDVEYGGWGIDPKRPFGNSDVPADICELLGLPTTTTGVWDVCEDEPARAYAASLYDDLGSFLKARWAHLRRDD